MDILEQHYGKEAFTVYALIANVPGKKTWPRVVFITTSIFLLTFSTLFQMTKLVIEKFKLEWIMDLVPSTLITLATLLYIPYVTFAASEKVLFILQNTQESSRSFFSQIFVTILLFMADDLKDERTEEEDAVQRKYTEGVRMFLKIYAVLVLAAMCGIPFSGFVPYFLDIIIPLNHSREMVLLANGEIFIDQEKYFYYIYFIEVGTVLAMCVIIGISVTMSIILGIHAYGMAAINGYRFENITVIKGYDASDKINYVELISSRLEKCIAEHQRQMQFATYVAEFYDIPLTFILVGSFCTLTVSFAQVMDPHLINMKTVLYTMAQFIQLFLVSCMGQYRIDVSLQVGDNAYNADWDACPANIRKMLQLVMVRSSKPCTIMARGVYVLSIENFMSIIQKITSFCMVLRQVQ